MKQTKIIMGMPITIEVVSLASPKPIETVFAYFRAIDRRFSPYKTTSELAKVNQGLAEADYSRDMREVLRLCEQTKQLSQGYFDINNSGQLDPSGLVKGWAINIAANKLHSMGYNNFYIEAGGDIQVSGQPPKARSWSVGIRSPFNIDEIVKVVCVSSEGVATSGTYIRGQHIYNPRQSYARPEGILSLSVIGPNIFEADRFATAAYAMGSPGGLQFINSLPGFEAYQIGPDKTATFTSGFEAYVAKDN